MMKIGYARTSTLDQQAGFEAQLQELEDSGCEKIFKEQVSAVGIRPELDAALSYLRDDDILIVAKLDRLARSTLHLQKILKALESRGAHLSILNLGIDTSTATGGLVLTILGAISQFEREMLLERQREGIRRAKERGLYRGRAPTARAKTQDVLNLKAQGVGPVEIGKRLGIGRTSVYRILKDAEA